MKKLKYFIPSMIIMIMIFLFSQQTGSQSSSLSGGILYWVQTHLHITIPELFIRKAAHMSEYALLCLSFIYAFKHYNYSLKRIFIYSICCSFLYACSDEFHQLFIPNRAGSFIDVLIDTTGSILITFIYGLLKKE